MKPETHLLLQDPEPLLAELRPSSNRFVPHDREVGPRAEVLSDGDGDVQVEHHVPVAAGNEDGLARMLNQLDLKFNEEKSQLLFLSIDASKELCFDETKKAGHEGGAA